MRIILFLIMTFMSSLDQAQWSNDPDINSWIPKSGEERVPIAASDGRGGVIVAWDDGKGILDIWANRVDRYGLPRWGVNGIRISPPQGIRDVTNVISDGDGGAIIVWDDYTRAWRENPTAEFIANEIYVQRVDSTGKILWDSSGVLIRGKVPNVGKSAFGILTSDHQTYIVTFFEGIAYGSSDVALDFYGQKIDLDGKIYWGEGSKRLNLEDNIFNIRHRIVSDGAGGFLLVWFDPNPPRGTIVDRYSENGDFVWKQGHINTNAGGAFEACSDGKGGVIVVGVDFPGGGWRTEGRIQRVDKDGRLCWTDSAVVFVKNRGEYLQYRIVQTDNSGAIVSWTDSLGFNPERHFLAFDSTGSIGWRRDGFAYGATSIYHPITLGDGFGNMIMIINDYLKSEETKEGHQLAFKMDASGDATWGNEGVLFRHRPYNDWPFSIVGVPDGQGGIIVVWYEVHQNTSYDITLQQINHQGQLGQVSTAIKPSLNPAVVRQFVLQQNYPNPFNPVTEMAFEVNEPASISLKIYNINGNLVAVLFDKKSYFGKEVIKWDGRDTDGQLVSSGIYFYELSSDRARIVRKMILIH
jgi:hypothetical protein